MLDSKNLFYFLKAKPAIQTPPTDNSRAHDEKKTKNNSDCLEVAAAESDALIVILITDPGKTQCAIRIHGEKLKVNSRGCLPRSVSDR